MMHKKNRIKNRILIILFAIVFIGLAYYVYITYNNIKQLLIL